MKIVTVAEMQAIERAADAAGWSYAQMMERAGQGLAEIVQSFYGYEENQSVLGLVGPGNNGGDTLIALEHLVRGGWHAFAILTGARPDGDPLLERLRQAGGQAARVSGGMEPLRAWLEAAEVVIDGVFGTSFHLPLHGEAAELLKFVRQFPDLGSVVAVDCPSGVDLSSGAAAPETIPADVTVCMAAVKSGLLRFPAFGLAGTLETVEIGLPDNLAEWQAVQAELVTEERVRGLLPERPADGHKGTFGTVTVLAGSLQFSGAALLSASAAYRIGTGLVQIAAPAPLYPALAGQLPEAIWAPMPHENGALAESAVAELAKSLGKSDVLLFGPGFGLAETTAKLVRRMVEDAGAGTQTKGRAAIGFLPSSSEQPKALQLPPLVIDADGLKLLSRVEGWHTLLPKPAVLTPHPGEMAILTGLSVEEINANRLDTARRFARQWQHVLVLKGANTVIAAPDGRVGVSAVATSALAHAGTGDVLAGIIAGLRAQGMAAFDAAQVGVWLHGQCGVLAAEQVGHEASVLASDLLAALPDVLSWVW